MKRKPENDVEIPKTDTDFKTHSDVLKKRIVKTVCLVLAVVLGLFVVVSVGEFLAGKSGSKKFDLTVKQEGIYYFPEDYSNDISERLLYTIKERRVYFVDAYGVGDYLTEENPVSNSAVGILFNGYFQALVDGDSEALNLLFTESYFNSHVNPKKFTPQMVYDIKVEFYNSEFSDAGYLERYVVSYKIMENNGSFRADVRSDAAKPLVYEVLTNESKSRISSIYPVINQ